MRLTSISLLLLISSFITSSLEDFSLSQLTFGGSGDKDRYYANNYHNEYTPSPENRESHLKHVEQWASYHEHVTHYQYFFSSGFQDEICSTCVNDYGSGIGTNCWGVQGISSYGPYITRSLYQMGTGDECNGEDRCGEVVSEYIAITVMKKEEETYSNILVHEGNGCHAGDMVLNQINGVYYFFVACTSYLAIWSEKDIEKIPEGIEINDKVFFYYVSEVIKTSLDDVSFSYISRYHGMENQYIAGLYSKSSCTDGLNLKIITINPETDWAISVVTNFTVASKVAKSVQGATIVDGSLFLTTSTAVRQCSTDGNVVDNCKKSCASPKLKFCGKSLLHLWKWGKNGFSGSGARYRRGVLQGAETDDDGFLYIGTEFGECQKYPFYQMDPIDCKAQLTNWDSCDITTDSTSVHSKQCRQVSTGWNLKVTTGPSSYAKTDDRIMFSYCLDTECSDWFELNHCSYDDFDGSCLNEYFIVPGLSEDMSTAEDAEIEDYRFEFVNCGSDGLQVDHVSIGYKGGFGSFYTFSTGDGDEKNCKFASYQADATFVVDKDHCGLVSLSWDGISTNAAVYSESISGVTRSSVCSVNPKCAGDSNGCAVNSAQVNIVPRDNAKYIHRELEPKYMVYDISGAVMYIMIGLVILSVVLLSVIVGMVMPGCCKKRRQKRVVYDKVNVASSDDHN